MSSSIPRETSFCRSRVAFQDSKDWPWEVHQASRSGSVARARSGGAAPAVPAVAPSGLPKPPGA
eukprot:2074026-Pyramimonas_sp.AAC.2